MDCREVFDFGIDNRFPGNPFVFISQEGQHPNFPNHRVLIYHPDGELKFDGRHQFLHNEKGIYHKVQYRKQSKQLYLFDRREDLERLNLPLSTPEPELVGRAARVFGKQRAIPTRQGSPAPSNPQQTDLVLVTEQLVTPRLSPLELLHQTFAPTGEPPRSPSSPSTIVDPLDAVIHQTPINVTTNLPSTAISSMLNTPT